MLKTEIIAVGTELLTPYFQDTNSLFLTEGLNSLGITVSFKTVVGDDEANLLEAAKTALRRSRLILVIGGLGPTEDDRTRQVFAAALGRKLIFSPIILADIRRRFRRRGRPMPANNRRQSYVIEGAEILDNPNGTAPGLWIQVPRATLVFFPGPPHELKPMFESHVRPRLTGDGATPVLRRTIKLTGIGESLMESAIKDIYAKIPADITVTTLASPGDLSIHLSTQGEASRSQAEAKLDKLEKELRGRLEPWIYSWGENLETVVGALLKERGLTVACAESCTGGLLGHRLTNVPGSSAYFLESAVVYDNLAKTRRLGVPRALIAKHGAVSSPVARSMAAGIRKTSGADYGVSITGIAGPDGGTAAKPVGLVYIALADKQGVTAGKNLFWGGREQVKFLSSQKALDILRKRLIKRRKKT